MYSYFFTENIIFFPKTYCQWLFYVNQLRTIILNHQFKFLIRNNINNCIYFIILLYILVKLRKTMIEDSRMTNFIFLERDNNRNVKNDNLKNFREAINFGNIFTYIYQSLSYSWLFRFLRIWYLVESIKYCLEK